MSKGYYEPGELLDLGIEYVFFLERSGRKNQYGHRIEITTSRYRDTSSPGKSVSWTSSKGINFQVTYLGEL